MHAIFFSLKRAHHRTLARCRELLAPFGLTPARFDMLYAIHAQGRGWLAQRALVRKLGVTAATVSRMLRSLIDLGLVNRVRHAVDHRCIVLHLTAEGRFRVRRVLRRCIGSGAVEHLVFEAVTSRWYDLQASFEDAESLEIRLGYVRHNLSDHASLFYPWHPDD